MDGLDGRAERTRYLLMQLFEQPSLPFPSPAHKIQVQGYYDTTMLIQQLETTQETEVFKTHP